MSDVSEVMREKKDLDVKRWQRTSIKADSLYRKLPAWAFRVTGWRFFIAAYLWKRNCLLSLGEIKAVASRLRGHPGPFLVFGAGNDSLLWAVINRGAPTVFLESDSWWALKVSSEGKCLRVLSVTYTTRIGDIRPPEQEMSRVPELLLPEDIRGRLWPYVMVDAPQGWGDGPGRAQSIFEAARLVGPGGRIFVHDCDRQGEQHLVARYLTDFRCEKLTPRLWSFERPPPEATR